MVVLASPNTFRLRVTLSGSEPLVWRELLVPSNVRLDRLHRIIQAVMGWEDRHIHEFRVGELSYGPFDDEDDDLRDETEYILDAILDGESEFDYEYDFGDSWLHRIEITERTRADSVLKFAVAIAGENACPMEDSGGVIRHAMLREILGSPDHEHQGVLKEELGTYDPTAFDLLATNARLQRI